MRVGFMPSPAVAGLIKKFLCAYWKAVNASTVPETLEDFESGAKVGKYCGSAALTE